jgi:hypothetical protein
MNWFVFSAGILAIIAFFIHALIGDKEYRLIRPEKDQQNSTYMDSWIQGRSGWYWVSMDLLLTGCLLVLISTTDYLDGEKTIALLLGVYFLFTGTVWFGTVLISKTNNKQILILGQWMLCFLLSALILLGRGTL